MQKADYRDKLRDVNYLPSMRDLLASFPLSESFRTDSKEFPWLNPEFTKFQRQQNNYQLYTQEFVASLAKYIALRLSKYAAGSEELVVLEVGAGDGRLTQYLKAAISPGIHARFVATDSMDWEKSGKTNPSIDVERIDYSEALKKYSPVIVISCWMNVDVDWTQDFRDTASVKEYILIGDVLRTAGYGAGWYLPKNSNFFCHKLTRKSNGKRGGVIRGSIGRFDASPYNPESRTEVYSFRRVHTKTENSGNPLFRYFRLIHR